MLCAVTGWYQVHGFSRNIVSRVMIAIRESIVWEVWDSHSSMHLLQRQHGLVWNRWWSGQALRLVIWRSYFPCELAGKWTLLYLCGPPISQLAVQPARWAASSARFSVTLAHIRENPIEDASPVYNTRWVVWVLALYRAIIHSRWLWITECIAVIGVVWSRGFGAQVVTSNRPCSN